MHDIFLETLRIYSAAENIFRIAIKDYRVDGSDHMIEKGTRIFISLFGVHRDPDIYPDPMKFDPERFNEENVNSRPAFTYFPFGEGPRLCIGKRFAMMQMRLGISSFISQFRVVVCPETPREIKFDVGAPLISSDKPVILKIEKL